MLIRYGVIIDCKTEKLWTPLHIAVLFGDTEIARLLVHAGSNVNMQDIDDETALHIAVRQGHHDLVTMLITRGAYINTPDMYGLIPLYSAALYGFSDIVQQLIDHGSYLHVPGINLERYIDVDAEKTFHNIMQIIKNTSKSNAAVVSRIREQSPQLLINQGAQTGVVFEYACDAKRQQLLADKGLSRRLYHCLREHNALVVGIGRYKVPVIWLLYAVQYGDEDVCRRLLACDDIQKYVNRLYDDTGNRLLHIAVQRNCIYIFRQLCMHQAYPEYVNTAGYRVYDIARARNNTRAGKIIARYALLTKLFVQAKEQYNNGVQSCIYPTIFESKVPIIGCLPFELLQKIIHDVPV
jgi:ankyrin repeat protein